METLYEETKQILLRPLKDARRKLLIILNLLFIVLLIAYLLLDKITTGQFVPHNSLLIIYSIPFALNVLSAYYNLLIAKFIKEGIQDKTQQWQRSILKYHPKIDAWMGWLSMIPIMGMSFCNLIGIGNPSNDALLTDYAFANSLLIGAVIIIGRKGATVWFVIVLAVLFWDVSRLGWDYEYHYMTSAEVKQYKSALSSKDPEALARQNQLKQDGLNPPPITRYFIAWVIFTVLVFMTAYYFSGITVDIFKIIPNAITNIEKAKEERVAISDKLEKNQNELSKSALRVLRYGNILEEMNDEIEKLEFQDRKKLIKIINIMRKALDEETDWEKFQANFDTVQNEFYKIIKIQHPELTNAEMKHLAFIKMNLSNTQISKFMDVKMESLRTLRHRLKRKMNLSDEIDLKEYIDNMDYVSFDPSIS